MDDDRTLTVYKGRQAYEYPDGVIRDAGNGQIMRPGGHIGIPPGDSKRAKELHTIRYDGLRAAVTEGAIRAAERLGVGSLPTDTVAAVTEALAVRAVEGNDRAANEAARLFFQAIGLLGGKAESAEVPGGLEVTARFQGQAARDLLDAIQAERARRGTG